VRKKTNLLIFITPSIVTDVAEATQLTREKTLDAGEQLVEQMGGSPAIKRSGILEEDEAPVDDTPDTPYEAGPK
jgi:type II secretory pathway component GspD/PulD (secretin)